MGREIWIYLEVKRKKLFYREVIFRDREIKKVVYSLYYGWDDEIGVGEVIYFIVMGETDKMGVDFG